MNAFHSTNLFCCFSCYQAPANNVDPPSVYKPHTTHNSSIRSDEGLTLETSAFECLYGGKLTLSTQLIKPNYLVILPPTQHHSFFRNLPPLYLLWVTVFYLSGHVPYNIPLDARASIYLLNLCESKLFRITSRNIPPAKHQVLCQHNCLCLT